MKFLNVLDLGRDALIQLETKLQIGVALTSQEPSGNIWNFFHSVSVLLSKRKTVLGKEGAR